MTSWVSEFEYRPTGEVHQPLEGPPAGGEGFSEVEREYVGEVEGLRPECWAELPPAERVRALQELEARLSEIEGRPSAEVRSEPLGPGERGCYDRQQGAIIVAEQVLADSAPFEAIEVVAQQGRHAYQHYAAGHPEIHVRPAEVDAWQNNLDNFLSAAQFGYELYRLQPLVADAVGYGESVLQIFQEPFK